MSAGRAKLESRLETNRLFQISDRVRVTRIVIRRDLGSSSSYRSWNVTGSRIITVTLLIELI